MTVKGAPSEPKPLRRRLPLDLVAICVLAILMAMLIGAAAGLAWLRVFGP